MNWKNWLCLAALWAAVPAFAAENGGAAFLERRFKELDKNEDGKLTPEEFNNAALFKQMDPDGDGVVVLDEARKGFAELRPVNGSNAAPAVVGGGPEQIFKALDKNNDGKLTKVESGNATWFDRLDPDGDGVVTFEEAKLLGILVRRRSGAGRALPGAPEEGNSSPEESPRQGPKVLRASDRGVGRLVSDLTFTDINRKTGKLSDYKSSKVLVIAFTSTTCPLTKKYAPSLERLEKEFAASGATFLFVNPIASDSLNSIKAMTRGIGFTGRYVHDQAGKLSAALGAQTTTEILVLDAARTLVFRGAVDDQYGLGYALDAPRHTYLKDALAALLAGQSPKVAATEAPGCALDEKPAPALTQNITYHNRVSRILQNNCLECHHAGGLAPFSLETYDDLKSHAAMMRKQVERGAMPPWFAAPPDTGQTLHWRNDRSLSPEDKADLLMWLASDKPRGNPADTPLPRVFPTEWQIGKPDVVLQLPRVVAIKAEGVMPYQLLTVQTKFSEDKWVQAYELQPTAREAVHHIIVRIHNLGTDVNEDDGDSSGERDGFFAAYVPGNSHAIFPDGFAKKIPAGATVSFQIHYTPNGEATTDQTKLGLLFAQEPPRHTIHVAGLASRRLSIPPGAANHPETTSITLPFDTTLLSFMPHMHVRGKAARYEATLPNGSSKVLLDVPRYDFNWQLQYKLAEPLTLPRGTKLIYTAWYDNSAENPANPDPTKLVRWGDQTYDEMMLGYVEYFFPAQKSQAQAHR